METISIRAYTNDDSQIEAIKAFMKALKIKFELERETSPYRPEFVEKIRQGDEDIKHLAPKWSRRITKEHRIVYHVQGDILYVYSVRGHYE